MVDAVSIALSGLMAQGLRLAVTANNVANANTSGAVPTAKSPVSTVYKPLSVSYTALVAGASGAGVRALATEKINGYSVTYDPSNIYANNEGLIAVPNVDLALESASLLEIKSLFKANLAVIKTHDQMLGDLMDTIT